MQPWYLSYIIIHDIQTGEKFRFLADRYIIIFWYLVLSIFCEQVVGNRQGRLDL